MRQTARRRVSSTEVRRHAGRYSLLMALCCVAAMGLYLRELGLTGRIQSQRAAEEDLLRKGDAIRRAIAAYVDADPAGDYPTSFDDLLLDARVPFVRRFLRDPYQDPMTDGPWAIVRGARGELYGVYSAAAGVPLKQGGFPARYAGFATRDNYQDWTFTVYPATKGGTR